MELIFYIQYNVIGMYIERYYLKLEQVEHDY
jgi:hypothetical protein